MEAKMTLNGKKIHREIEADSVLYDFLRSEHCYSVKCGCETANCGACTVLMDGEPILSCGLLTARADGHEITTLEGLQEEAKDLGSYIADQGAEQCGFCNPGYIVNTISLLRKNPEPTEQEVWEYLAGNLCRCTGYEGQKRGIMNYIEHLKKVREAGEKE